MKWYMGIMILQCLTTPLYSQTSDIRKQLHVPDSTVVQIIRLHDGTVLNGTIVAIQADSIMFQSAVGLVSVPIANISEIKDIPKSSIVSGEYWFPNPNRTRLFLGPTGYMLGAGEGYFQDIYIFFVGGAVGITDWFSIGGGISLIPGSDDQLYYLTPKIGFELSKNVHVAAGTLLMSITSESEKVGIHYAVGTYGSPDNNLTGGIGYAFSGGDIADQPIFAIGGQLRASRSVAFVTENWIVPGDELTGIISFGVRFFGENISADLALLRSTEMTGEGFPFIPYVDFVVNF